MSSTLQHTNDTSSPINLRKKSTTYGKMVESVDVDPVTRLQRWAAILHIDDDPHTSRAQFWALSAEAKEEVKEQRTIGMDVVRTRADEPFFQGEIIRELMSKALQCFCGYYDFEYMQGLNEVLAPLLAINIASIPGHYSALNLNLKQNRHQQSKSSSGDAAHTDSDTDEEKAGDNDEDDEFAEFDCEYITEGHEVVEKYELQCKAATERLRAAAAHAGKATLTKIEMKKALKELNSAQEESKQSELLLKHEKKLNKAIIQYTASFVLFEKLVIALNPAIFALDGIYALQGQLVCFHSYLFYCDSELATYLSAQGLRCDMYAQAWFITLFARRVTVELVLYTWEHMLQRGYITEPHKMIALGVAILIRHRNHILYELNPDDVPNFMTHIHFEDIAEVDECFRIADCIHLNLPKSLLNVAHLSGFDCDILRQEREELLSDLMSRPCAMSCATDIAAYLMQSELDNEEDGNCSNDTKKKKKNLLDSLPIIIGRPAFVDNKVEVKEIHEVEAVKTAETSDNTPVEQPSTNLAAEAASRVSGITTVSSSSIFGLSVNEAWRTLDKVNDSIDAVLPTDEELFESVSNIGNSLSSISGSWLTPSARGEDTNTAVASKSLLVDEPTTPKTVTQEVTNAEVTSITTATSSNKQNKSKSEMNVLTALQQYPKYLLIDCRSNSESLQRCQLTIEGSLPIPPDSVNEICRAAAIVRDAVAHGKPKVEHNPIKHIKSEETSLLLEFLSFCSKEGGLHFVLYDADESPQQCVDRSKRFTYQLATALLVLGYPRVSIIPGLEVISARTEMERQSHFTPEKRQERISEDERTLLCMPIELNYMESRMNSTTDGYYALILELVANLHAEIKEGLPLQQKNNNINDNKGKISSTAYLSPSSLLGSGTGSGTASSSYHVATNQTSIILEKVHRVCKMLNDIRERREMIRIKNSESSSMSPTTPLGSSVNSIGDGKNMDTPATPAGKVAAISKTPIAVQSSSPWGMGNLLGSINLPEIPNVTALLQRAPPDTPAPTSALDVNSGALNGQSNNNYHHNDHINSEELYSSAALRDQYENLEKIPANISSIAAIDAAETDIYLQQFLNLQETLQGDAALATSKEDLERILHGLNQLKDNLDKIIQLRTHKK
jgi:hypothetical protein